MRFCREELVGEDYEYGRGWRGEKELKEKKSQFISKAMYNTIAFMQFCESINLHSIQFNLKIYTYI